MSRLAASALVILLGAPAAAQELENEDYRQLVNLVDAAAAAVTEEGEAAFPAIRDYAVKWLGSDARVFAGSLDGVLLLEPEHPELEGKAAADVVDPDGRPWVRWAIEAARSEEGAGWIHFRETKPGESGPTWKTCHVVRAGKHFVGSGLYGHGIERAFLVDTVERAARRIEEEGAAAFAEFHAEAGPFRWRDVYVFVIAFDGTELVSGGFPELEGKNVWELRDADGRLIVQEMVGKLEEEPTAWLEYLWPRPGQEKPARKRTYGRRIQIGDRRAFVAAGTYLPE